MTKREALGIKQGWLHKYGEFYYCNSWRDGYEIRSWRKKGTIKIERYYKSIEEFKNYADSVNK